MIEMHMVCELLCQKVNYAEKKPWKGELPTHPRQQAVVEHFRAKKATFSNYMAGNSCRFEMKPRSRYKLRQEGIPLERYCLEDPCIYDRTKYKGKGDAFIIIPYARKEMKLKIRGKVPKEFRGQTDKKKIQTELKLMQKLVLDTGTHSSRLKFFKLRYMEVRKKGKFGHSIGAGIHKFQTRYDSSGSCGDVFFFGPLNEIPSKADYFQSEMDDLNFENSTSRWRRSLKRRFLRALEHVRNRINDLHNRVASWLVHTFYLTL